MAVWTEFGPFTPEAMTTSERDAEFNSPPNNLTIFNTTIGMYQVFVQERWISIPQYATVAATTAPGVGDDSDDGYTIGDRWLDVTADEEYVCFDVTVGAAVWKKTTAGERQVEIVIPLLKALPAATNNATLDDDYVYKKPYNTARRINKWYIRFESNLAAEAIFELRRNGTALTGSSITIAAAARDAAIDSFTEVTLDDGDSLEVWQTTGNAEDIGGRAYVYGDEDVVAVVS